MTPPTALAWALLVPGIVTQVLCVLGLLVFPDTQRRVHLLGPSSGVGALLVAGSVAVDSAPLAGGGLKAVLVAVVLVGTGPMLAHAIARAAARRERKA